jgi:hypothetical protein
MTHKLVTKSFTLPNQSSVDALTEMFRAVLSQRGSVQRISFTVDPSELSVDVYVPDDTPPFGEPHEATPETLWGALSEVELEEVDEAHSGLNIEAMKVLTTLLLKVSARKLSGVAWAVGNVDTFLRWIGVRVKNDTPDTFWNLPLIKLDGLQDGALVLLCAKSSRVSVLQAKVGYLVHTEEAEDVGSRE